MRQRVPCESARQLLDVVLSADVSLAAATALWSGSSDCTHPSTPVDLPQVPINMNHKNPTNFKNQYLKLEKVETQKKKNQNQRRKETWRLRNRELEQRRERRWGEGSVKWEIWGRWI